MEPTTLDIKSLMNTDKIKNEDNELLDDIDDLMKDDIMNNYNKDDNNNDDVNNDNNDNNNENNNNDDNFNPSLISKNSNYKSKINLKDEAVIEYFNS